MSIASSTASTTLFELVAQMGEITGVVALRHRTQCDDLVALGIAAGRREQPGREAQRARVQPVFEQRRHLRQFGRGRRPRRHAHHIEPQGVMADQHAGVDRDRREIVEIFGETGLAERQPRRAGAQIIADQFELAGQHRRHRKPAMADDLGRHPLAHFAFGLGVDRQGEVGMRLDVDKARRHRQTRGLYDPRRPGRQRAAERRDTAVADRDIADLARPAAAVDQDAAADQDLLAHRPRPASAYHSTRTREWGNARDFSVGGRSIMVCSRQGEPTDVKVRHSNHRDNDTCLFPMRSSGTAPDTNRYTLH